MEPIVLFKQGMLLVVVLSAPPLIVAVVVGVLTSLVQALMQVQDQTLPFGIKLVAVGITLALTFVTLPFVVRIGSRGLAKS